MWNWLAGGQPPAAKKTKTTDERREIQRTYEKNKRHRSFQEEWRNTFKWLIYRDEKMYCNPCEKHENSSIKSVFITGCTNFKIDILKKHESSESHRRCMEKLVATQTSHGQSVAEKSVIALNKAVSSKLSILFRNAHFVAKLGKPYTEFVSLCKLDKAKEINIGETCINDRYCQKFIANIADTRRAVQRQEVEKAKYLSVLSDGATDSSRSETEIVYARISYGCKIQTFFMGLKHIRKADAENITRTIQTLLDESLPGLWRERIIAMGTDGASVMIGHKGGVVKRMAESLNKPFIRAIHCSAHRLELAYKEAVIDIKIHNKCELLLLNLYLFYSPLNRANLRATFDAIGSKQCIPTRVGGTRWLPHTERALKKVLTGRKGLLLHLEQMQQDSGKEASCKAKHFLKLVKDDTIIYWLHFLTDVIKCLSTVSLVIQEKNSTVAEISEEIENSKLILERYKTSAGPSLRSFCQETDINDKMENRKVKMLDGLISSISKRFSGDAKLFVPAAALLSIKHWPDFQKEIGFGDEHIQKLVEVVRPALDPSVDIDSIEGEWTRLKSSLVTRKQSFSVLTWPDLEEMYGTVYSNLFHLINYLLTLPGSSCDAERGFSRMKMIKTDWRGSLGAANLSDQILVNLETEEVDHFDPLPAVVHWYNGGERAR